MIVGPNSVVMSFPGEKLPFDFIFKYKLTHCTYLCQSLDAILGLATDSPHIIKQ